MKIGQTVNAALFGEPYGLTRILFQRFLGAIYFLAFLIAAFQFRSLCGEHGLLPSVLFVKQIEFWQSPSIFFWNASDIFIFSMACCGLFLAILTVTGISESFGIWFSGLVWFLLWVLYLSFVNVGQVFYGFGWESLLLETGFLAIFLGSKETAPPAVIFWLYRWVLFRLMFGAGMIKLRGDDCWRQLTCMDFHYETQPLPNPLSWYFHHLPSGVHRFEVLGTHFVELIIPFFLFVPGPLGASAALFTALFQGMLILSGNLSWLNYITILLCIACLDDNLILRFIKKTPPTFVPMGIIRKVGIGLVVVFIIFLSFKPAVNLFSRRQMMNASFDPFHLVNTYGAFGSISRERYEVVIEGTLSEKITGDTEWREYEFKGKPGKLDRRPCFVSPYHWKLDWQMWFAAMSDYRYHPWMINLIAKLLKNDSAALSLISDNPFPSKPPVFIRARLYLYQFTSAAEHRKTGAWWKRILASEYVPPVSINDPGLRAVLAQRGWD